MPIVEEICTITAKGQTTVPRAIRQALGVRYGGRIAFRIESGAVTVRAADEPEDDPALGPFLALLERDLSERPESVTALTPSMIERIEAATEGADADPDEPIAGEVAL